MKRHIIGMLAIAVIIAAIAGVAASTAHAAAFACTSNQAQVTVSGTTVSNSTLYGQDQVLCNGGNGGAYVVHLQWLPTNFTTAFWPDHWNSNALTNVSDMPAESCGTPNNQYAYNSQHLLKITMESSPTCGTDTNNQHTYNNLPTKDASGASLGKACQYDWQLLVTATQLGTPQTTITVDSIQGTHSC